MDGRPIDSFMWRRRDTTPWRAQAKPLLRRATDCGSTSYHTFGTSATSSTSNNLGQTMQNARRRLVDAIERKIEEKERSTHFTQEFRDPFALLLVVCALFRFLDAVRRRNTEEPQLALAAFCEATFLVASAVLNVRLNITQKRRHHDEMAERVRTAVKELIQSHSTERKKDDDGSERYSSPSSVSATKPTILLPSNSYVACYRDNVWQRLPMNLLVEGDVLGLMSGDIAPGSVRLLVDLNHGHELVDHDDVDETASASFVYPRGSKLPSWRNANEYTKETTRCNATFRPALLLDLCGEMRIFELLETPVIRDIEDALFRINRPETFTQKLQAKARLIAIYVCTLYSVLVLVAIGLRVVLQHRTMDTTMNHILLGPIGIWLCFASLNTPLVLFLAEAAATAIILGSFENNVLPKDKNTLIHDSSSEQSEKENPPSSPQSKTPFVRLQRATGSPRNSMHVSDIYDVEDREQIRSEKAYQESAVRRTLEYFLVALKFRTTNCASAHASDHTTLPVPFRSFRLLERLGSTTMLCCFDDDVLCEQSPSVEEIFLLTDKNGGSSIVLDLHPDRDCETGLKFEDPKWKHYLPSLKPIGLAIMLNDNADPARLYQRTMNHLVNESICTSGLSIRNPPLRSCVQRLSAHIRMLPFPKHLLNLSREIGFVEDDLTGFQRQQTIQIICPRLAHYEHTIDHHDQGQEDTRYRGNLKTHLHSTVVLDKRSNRHQLLSRGHPSLALTQCSEFWDGKSICPLTSEKRRVILDMYNQWRVEDLDCVAFSYVPVSHKLSNMFNRTNSSNNRSSSNEWNLHHHKDMLPPVYLVDDSSSGDNSNWVNASGAARTKDGSIFPDERSNFRERGRSQPTISPMVSPDTKQQNESPAGDMEIVSISQPQHRTSSTGFRPLSPSKQLRNSIAGMVSFSDVTSSVGIRPSETGSSERDSLLWRMQEDQIFLGMVATGVQPKKSVPDFIEDLTACGIRFVYFSPRNMRRSKLLAEKMGIETDWNCAISLRPLESDGPDPHRMTSNYSDWDVKARLPHGVEAIKKHLQEVDNVPLLVSLYTDSTPETISEMISIFQENNEVVLGVGSSLKEVNAPLYSKADSAIALQGGVHAFFNEKLPSGHSLPLLSEEDLQFSQILNTLACSFRIKSAEGETTLQDNKYVASSSNLMHLIELIRLGRCVLTNFHQLVAFIFVSQLLLATLILLSYIVPFPLVPQLSCASIFWLLWVLVPALSLPMLASASERDVMKKTPRKNEPIELQEDLPRLSTYFLLRHVPSALFCIIVFECLLGFSLEATRAHLSGQYQDFSWVDFIFHNALTIERPRPPVLVAAINRAEAGMLLMIGVCIIASSSGYLHRSESIFVRSPLRNRMWMGISALLLVVQLLISIQRASVAEDDGLTLWGFVTEAVPWSFWVGMLVLWPMIVVAVDELVKNHDRHHLTRYYKFLRMQFDTRLGMWSPK